MKRIVLILIILGMAGYAYAQCVGEIKDVLQDEVRGSIIVETQYILNGVVVDVDGTACSTCIGRSRYDEGSGTNEEIIAKAKADVAEHCENLIRRIPTNTTYISANMLTIQKDLTTPIITAIKDDLVGVKTTKTQAVDTFKGKDIKVTYDSKNTIFNTAVVEP